MTDSNMDQDMLLKQMYQLIPSGVGIYDVTGSSITMVYLNDGYYQMIGASREQRRRFEGKHAADVFHPDDRAGLFAEAEASIREKRVFEYKYRALITEGHYHWLFIRANHVRLNETTERFFAAYYDINELMQMQKKLQEDELVLEETLKYSGTTHFIYFIGRHRYETVALPEQYSRLPKSMDDYPDSFIRYVAMPAEDAGRYREMLQRIDDGAEEADCEVRMQYLGKYQWFRVSCRAIPNEAGRTEMAVGTAVLTDRFHDAQLAFRTEKQHLKSLQKGLIAVSAFNVTRDISLEEDQMQAEPDLREKPLYKEALLFEPALARQRNETLQTLLSAAGGIPDPKERRQFILASSHAGMLRLYQNGEREKALQYRRIINGRLIWVSTRIALMADPVTGDVLAYFYTSDINDAMIYRRITAGIIEKNFDNVSYLDLGTQTLYRTQSAENRQTFTSQPYREAVESALSDFVSSDETDAVRKQYNIANMRNRLQDAPVCSIFYKTRQRAENLPGKPFRRMKSDFYYLDEHQDIIVILQSDVTQVFEQDRAQREKAEAAMHEAESANSAKTEFLSRMSHDMRTPLNGIIGMTYLTREMDLPEKAQENLKKIDISSRFLLGLINEVLDMSKAESGKMELHPEPYPVDEFADYMNSIIAPLCAERSQIFSFEPEVILDDVVPLMDKLRVNQVVFNLLSNAVKYTQEGGTIRYRIFEKKMDDSHMTMHLEIMDNGIGMSEEFQKVLFEPFTQENREYSSEMRGTGLGLSITKRLIDAMGGTIAVKSRLGEGTTFFVDFLLDCSPAHTEKAGKKKDIGQGENLAGRHILLCEDHPLNQEIAKAVLEEGHMIVTVADDGEAGVKAFNGSSIGYFDCILMDIHMPVMDGYESTKTIRGLKRADAMTVPIIAMTADAFTNDIQKCLQAGMNGHIAKPIDPKLLYNKLSETIINK
jgi:PAS domain S-box-containing protein